MEKIVENVIHILIKWIFLYVHWVWAGRSIYERNRTDVGRLSTYITLHLGSYVNQETWLQSNNNNKNTSQAILSRDNFLRKLMDLGNLSAQITAGLLSKWNNVRQMFSLSLYSGATWHFSYLLSSFSSLNSILLCKILNFCTGLCGLHVA